MVLSHSSKIHNTVLLIESHVFVFLFLGGGGGLLYFSTAVVGVSTILIKTKVNSNEAPSVDPVISLDFWRLLS